MSSTDPGKRLTDWVFRKSSQPSTWGENLFHEMHSPSWEESCYTSKGQRDGSPVSNRFQDFDLWGSWTNIFMSYRSAQAERDKFWLPAYKITPASIRQMLSAFSCSCD